VKSVDECSLSRRAHLELEGRLEARAAPAPCNDDSKACDMVSLLRVSRFRSYRLFARTSIILDAVFARVALVGVDPVVSACVCLAGER